MTDTPLTARIEVFRPGTFTPMSGAPITYSAADLRAIADAYDPATAPAPVVVGHPEADTPAFGWVKKFDYDTQAGRLYADLHEIEPAFAEAVKAGRYKKVSMAFFLPDQAHNPVPGTWYPKHVGFLGAAAPAVSGLKNAAFGDAPGAVFTAAFSDGLAEETGSLLRMLREFLIEKFGMDDADKALPSWRIEWLEKADDPPRFAAPPDSLKPVVRKETPPVTTETPPPDAAFAAREADLATREAAIAAREKTAAHQDHVAFAEGLVTEGRLLPASKEKVVALLDALPGHAAVQFAEGAAKISAGEALREVLKAQPKVVSFGRADLPEGGEGGTAAAFAADGKAVDSAGLVTHQKALDYQRTHPGTAYLDAVRAVS